MLSEEHYKAFADLTADERRRRKIRGNETAAELRRVADRVENRPFRAFLYSAINSILIEAARTPQRDCARIIKTMHEFGGGKIGEIAKDAKLPPRDVRRVVEAFVSEGVAYRSAEGDLYFLTSDRTHDR